MGRAPGLPPWLLSRGWGQAQHPRAAPCPQVPWGPEKVSKMGQGTPKKMSHPSKSGADLLAEWWDAGCSRTWPGTSSGTHPLLLADGTGGRVACPVTRPGQGQPGGWERRE